MPVEVEARGSERDDASDVIATSSKGSVDTSSCEIASLSGGGGGGGGGGCCCCDASVKLLTALDKLTVVLAVKEVTFDVEGEQDDDVG